MTSAPAPLRRIAVHAAGSRVDLVVPVGDALDHALAVAGVRLGPGDRVFGPGGAAVEPGTAAAELREGGLYAIASARTLGAEGTRAARSASGVRVLQWGLVAVALTAAAVAFAADSQALRWATAAVIGIAALVSTRAIALRPTGGAGAETLAVVSTMLLGGIAATLIAPRDSAGVRGELWDAMFACALGFAGVALVAVLLAATARAREVRASAATAALLSSTAALLALGCPLIGWGPREFFVVAAAAAVLMLRALPALLVTVDEGYFIDYGRYMSLRWTVRGRVPSFVERVESDEVGGLVAVTESRLRIAIVFCSMLAVPGVAFSVFPLLHGNLVERIGAGAFLGFSLAALMLVSRRTVAPMLKRPQRLAALGGSLGAATLLALTAGSAAQWLLPAAVALLCAGVAVGAGSAALHRGARSLGWSRVGDIVEALAVALVLPAGLLAAGAIDVLRGVLS